VHLDMCTIDDPNRRHRGAKSGVNSWRPFWRLGHPLGFDFAWTVSPPLSSLAEGWRFDPGACRRMSRAGRSEVAGLRSEVGGWSLKVGGWRLRADNGLHTIVPPQCVRANSMGTPLGLNSDLLAY
jgi:hypothetical protein